MEWLRYANQGAIRNQPLAPDLANALSFLGDMGVTMEVFSGGQDAKGHGHRRTGSTRHDHGKAADVFFYKDGRKLDWANPQDRPVFGQIVQQAKSKGVTGFGAGQGYMQPGSMHIGFGAPSVWGAGGKGATAPDWLRAAYSGAPAPSVDTSAGLLHTGTPSTGGTPVLSTQEAAPMEQQRKGLLGGLLSPEKRDHLIMALEGMTLNPNQALMQAAAARQGTRIEDERTAKQQAAEQREEQQRRSRTAEWLKANGREDLAAAVQSGVMTGAMALNETIKGPKERRIIKGADGLNYYEDGTRVLPGVAAPAGDQSAKEEQIARMVEAGLDRNTAILVADGVYEISRDPISGEAIVVNKATGQPVGGNQASPAQPGTPEPAPGPDPVSGREAFGVEGTLKGGVNTAADAVGLPVPYPEAQEAQATFQVLQESLLSDISNGYQRQPPSWLLKEIRKLTPEPGSPWEGPEKALSKLNAIQNSLSAELAAAANQINRKMSPKGREALEEKISGLEAALGRIQYAKKSLGAGGVEIRPEVADRLKAYQ